MVSRHDKSRYHRRNGLSAEAAWIATEGDALNHASGGMPNDCARRLAGQGPPRNLRNRRIRQTDGGMVERPVPGSFNEYIDRDIDPTTGRLDLSFDSGNATGVFHDPAGVATGAAGQPTG